MPTCVESFAGAGGLGWGLHQAGFQVLAAVDWDPSAVRTYQQNVSPLASVCDITQLDGDAWRTSLGLRPGDLDLFAGGPPCQGFSLQNRHWEHDPRNRLVLDYIRMVHSLQPKVFLLENVTMLGQKRGREFVTAIHSELSNYRVTPHVYNAADYGLAQTRRRFIMIGVRTDLPGSFHIPPPTVTQWRTVGDVLHDLPEPPLDPQCTHPDYPNHYRAKISAMNVQRFAFVPQGGGWQDIPWEYRLPCHQREGTSTGGWPDVFGRLQWDGQAPTITGGFDSFTRGRYGHPLHNRALTPREAARLQGFPDDFVFYGSRSEIRHQIGNAVPPPLAHAIGVAIRQDLAL